MNYSPEKLPTYIAFVFLAVFVIVAVTYINEGERKVPVSYTKQVRGNKLYGGASTYLPLKINQAGVIPIIFATSVLLFPQFFAQIAGVISQDFAASVNEWVNNVFNNIFLYSGLYFLLVVLFTYFYTSITFDPGEISKTLQQSGGFIPGIRPGQNTTNVIKKIVHRITLFGAIFLGIVAILPNLTQIATGIQTFAIGGASLLIVVAVALEVMKKVESQLTMREYEGL
jgi:preprotein translocase subunit SecY